MTSTAHLQAQIDELRDRLDALTGKPRGPITYQEAERDMRLGNKRTLERFIEQLAKGGNGENRSCGASSVNPKP